MPRAHEQQYSLEKKLKTSTYLVHANGPAMQLKPPLDPFLARACAKKECLQPPVGSPCGAW